MGKALQKPAVCPPHPVQALPIRNEKNRLPGQGTKPEMNDRNPS